MDAEIHKSTREQYRDLCMLRDRMRGNSIATLAKEYCLSKGTVSRRNRLTFYDLQIFIMRETQADPMSPRKGKFTLEQFNTDPQACRLEILNEMLANLEKTLTPKWKRIWRNLLNRTARYLLNARKLMQSGIAKITPVGHGKS